MATELQSLLCLSILKNDYGAYNGGKTPKDYIFDEFDFQVWSDCLDCSSVKGLPSGRALSGLVSSAKQAGLVGSGGEVVYLTKSGWELARSIEIAKS